MSEQPHLFPPPPAEGNLTARQQQALDYLRGRRQLTPLELGAYSHVNDVKVGRRHSAEEPCQWCEADGLGLLRALRARGLARYRAKLKVWEPTIAGDPPEPSLQTTEIPY